MATNAWKARRLDELGFVGRGKSRHRPRNEAKLYGGPYPFIQTAEIMAADPYITSYSQTYSEFGLQQSKTWPPNTLCMTIAGANTAKTAILRFEACFPDSVVGFISDKSKSDIHFVKYSLDLMRDRFLSVSRGTTQDNLSLDKLLSFPIPAPHVNAQHRIGEILSAYDELMENCRRRIRVLENMARSLFREWFVRQMLPAKRFVGAPALETRTLGDLCELVKEPFKQQSHATRPLLDLSRIPQRSIAPANVGNPSELTTSRIVFEPGDTLFGAIRCYLHKAVSAHFAGVTNTSVLVMRPRKAAFRALVALIASDTESIRWAEGHSSGTKMPVINWTVFRTMPAPYPNEALARRFEATAGSMLDQIGLLAEKIQNLRRTRNLLLPRLLSGHVSLDVSAVEDLAEPMPPAPPLSQTDFASEELALRAAEEAPSYRVKRTGSGLHPPAEPADERPLPIDQIDRTEVLQVIRQVFSEGPPRERDAAIRDVARALGYRRTGPRIQEILHTDLMTAVRRCILENQNGALRLCARSITDYDRDFLKQQFLAAIGRTWIDRDTAIRDFCRWLGFARTGPVIEDTARSLINGLLREGRLEADADLIRKKT
jgi:type I restriction enzyme S subunit